MDRRLFITSVALAGAAAPALAQTAVAPMGDAEAVHAKRTAAVGSISLKTSDIALQKSTNAKIKEFATFERDEQTTVAEIIKSMDPTMAPPAPDAKMTDMVAKLSEMKGAALDKAYVAGQIEGHEMLLAIQEDYLKVGKDMPTIAVTKLVRGMVKEHLALLADLHKTVG